MGYVPIKYVIYKCQFSCEIKYSSVDDFYVTGKFVIAIARYVTLSEAN
jgi:hypothetical protein